MAIRSLPARCARCGARWTARGADLVTFYDSGNGATRMWVNVATGTALNANTLLWDSGARRMTWSKITLVGH